MNYHFANILYNLKRGVNRMNKGNTLGSRIKYVREKMNYTGEEFGKLLNVTKVAVSNWENDNRKPDVDMIVKIANLSNVTTDFLLCNTDIENNLLSYILDKTLIPVEDTLVIYDIRCPY